MQRTINGQKLAYDISYKAAGVIRLSVPRLQRFFAECRLLLLRAQSTIWRRRRSRRLCLPPTRGALSNPIELKDSLSTKTGAIVLFPR